MDPATSPILSPSSWPKGLGEVCPALWSLTVLLGEPSKLGKVEKVTGRRVSSGFRVGIKLPPCSCRARHFVPWGSVFWSAKWGQYQLLRIKLSSMWMELDRVSCSVPLPSPAPPRVNSGCLQPQVSLPHFWRRTSPEARWTVLCGRLGADHPRLPPPMGRHFFPDWRAGQGPAWAETGWPCRCKKLRRVPFLPELSRERPCPDPFGCDSHRLDPCGSAWIWGPPSAPFLFSHIPLQTHPMPLTSPHHPTPRVRGSKRRWHTGRTARRPGTPPTRCRRHRNQAPVPAQ